ncbi:MAG TPA: NADH-quinone oxidoreductase subunit L [Terriglobales bacterium]|nr:NADH-quinone oxidoreductase subunit L [Terriglobales bacterium]
MPTNLHLWLIPLLPLTGGTVNGLLGRRLPKAAVTAIGLLFVAVSMLVTWWVAWQFFQLPASAIPHIESYGTWLKAGSFSAEYGLQLDQLSLVMALVVTGVGFLIHIYSVGYMAEDGGYYRFFSYLNLFMFFMLTLVLANNYLLMFVGWEGVGLASYLLIGFYFLRDTAPSAGKKAFIVNRVGDFGFLIALFLLIQHFGSLRYTDVFQQVAKLPAETAGAGLLTAVGLLMLLGATGKSAQIPLYVWLPDAMEGPTPVSALIHAATMVTAGIYMVSRSHAIFDRSPHALMAVAMIGTLTAFFAATIGITQFDIKRVLAYSTISQLGYMFAACGVAAYAAGMFHLVTHAFFKALLFLGAGSVIHAIGGEQDMRKMGGLRKYAPVTFWSMTMATLAIAGTPLFSGFFSKDMILFKTWTSPFGSKVYWAVLWFTAFLTAFYMFRLWFLTFFGEYRGETGGGQGSNHHAHGGHPHESPRVMLIPLIILAVLAVIGGWIGTPGNDRIGNFLAPVFSAYSEGLPAAAVSGEVAPAGAHESDHGLELTLTVAASAAGILGFLLAWYLYYRRRDLPAKIAEGLNGLYDLVFHKYYVDELYAAAIVWPIVEGSRTLLWRTIDAGLIDGTVNESARAAKETSDVVRQMQSGNLRSYAGWVAAGAAAVIAFMIWIGVR